MKTIKVTGPHMMFSPQSSFYSELLELATRDSTNNIGAREKYFTLPNGSTVEVKLYNKVYKHGDYSVAYLDGESSFNMTDLTGWSAAHANANVYDAPSFIRLTQDQYNNSLVPSGVYNYQTITESPLTGEDGTVTGYEENVSTKTWKQWIESIPNHYPQDLQDNKVGFALTDGNRYLDGKQIYTIMNVGFDVVKDTDYKASLPVSDGV